MPSATSKIDSAVANLITAINTQAAIASTITPVGVYEGKPYSQGQPDDLIVVAEEIQQSYREHNLVGTGGSGWLLEEFNISVVVDVYRGSDNYRTTRQRCETLVNAVDDAVRNDPSLAGAVITAWPSLHQYSQVWEEDGKGTRCKCEIVISCRALP